MCHVCQAWFGEFVRYRDFQVAYLKQNIHANKITKQSCRINAAVILLANSIT